MVIDAIVGDVAGKRAIVLDDEIATGGSIIELLDRLEAAGLPVDRGGVHARAVHRQGGRAAARRTRRITEVVTTDTVPPPTDGWPDLQVRSVATLFAEAIHRIHIGESVSSLFDGVDPTHAPPQPRLPFDDPT